MKRTNKMLPLVVLVVVLAVLAAALVFLSGLEEDEDTGLPLFNVDPDAVTAVYYRQQDDEDPVEVTLTLSDGTWSLSDDPTLPLDQDTVAGVVSNVSGLTALRDLGTDAETDEMGLDDPTAVLRLAVNGGDITAEPATGESASGLYTLTIGAENSITGAYYAKGSWGDNIYTIASSELSGLCKTPRQLYADQEITDLETGDVTAMTVELPGETLDFRYDGETWTLADDPDYPLDQDAVTKMASTVCSLKSQWSITSPEADSAYGLDAPDAVVTLTGSDGTTVTVRFGAVSAEDDSVSYLQASTAPDVVYEISSSHLSAYAYTKDSLRAATEETAATAESSEDDIVAENPVGGADDYADSVPGDE